MIRIALVSLAKITRSTFWLSVAAAIIVAFGMLAITQAAQASQSIPCFQTSETTWTCPLKHG
jgi:hypothetical protein